MLTKSQNHSDFYSEATDQKKDCRPLFDSFCRMNPLEAAKNELNVTKEKQ